VCENGMLTVKQAAARLNTGERFVRRLLAERRLSYTRLGPKGSHVRISAADLDALIPAGRVEPLSRSAVRRALRGVA